MNLVKLFGLGILFLGGVLAGLLLTSANSQPAWAQLPDGGYDQSLTQQVAALNPFQQVTPVASPRDRIPQNAIGVYHDRVVLDLKDAQWATFTDTHSMEPVISAGANAIEVVPHSEDEIQVGDIVSYRSVYAQGTIIHRVVYKGQDEQGTYFVLKGDNLPASDPGRIRFDQIERVVVAIVY